MTASWPGALPQAAIIGPDGEDLDFNVRTAMSVGPTKVRPRCTAVRESFNLMIKCTDTQVAVFNTFYRSTLINGALPFDWVHPLDSSAATWQFASAPRKRSIGPALWEITFQVETP